MSATSPSSVSTPRPPRVTDLGRLLLGLVVVAFGVVFLLDSADVLDASRTIDDWWPTILIGAGVFTLLERPPAVVRGTILSAIGIVALLFTTDVLHGNAWDYIWPAAVIAVGLLIASRWWGQGIPAGASDNDVVRATGIFGGPKVASTSQAFEGAWLTAVFGGVTLDLHDARPVEDGATINATAAFGGIDVLVPEGWHIAIRSTPIFGGVEDKTDHGEPPAPDAPVLRIDAVCLFGGVEIKHRK